MRNSILTFCLSFAVSLAFSQIHVTGPNGGDVGIGITAPTAKLDVNGSAILRGAGGWATFRIGADRTANGNSYFDLVPKTDGAYGVRFVSFDYGVASLAHGGASQFVIRTDKPNAPIWFRMEMWVLIPTAQVLNLRYKAGLQNLVVENGLMPLMQTLKRISAITIWV